MVTLAPRVVTPATFGHSDHTASANLTIARPVGVQNGDLLVAALRCGSSSQGSDYSAAGWTRQGKPFVGSSAANRVTGIYTHFVTDISSEPQDYVFSLSGNSFARQSGIMFIVRTNTKAEPWGVAPAIASADNFNAGPPVYIGEFSGTEHGLQIFALGAEVVAPYSAAWSALTDLDSVAVHGSLADQQNTGATRSVIGVASSELVANPAGGTTRTMAFERMAGTSAEGIVVAGSEALVEDNRPRFKTVGELLLTKGATVMHRAPTGYVASAKDTYDRGYVQGFSAFEISLSFSSDLVPFAHGKQYLDPDVLGNNGTTLDPNTMTWAEVQQYSYVVGSNAPQPLYSLEQMLIDFVDSGRGVALVDPKWGFATAVKVAAMLDICDAHGGPTKILIKFDSPTTNAVLRDAAHARGYKTINYWSNNVSALTDQQAGWDILGASYDAGSAMWDTIKSYGKPTWAAIVPTQESLDQAIIDTDADFYVMRTLAVIPVGPKTPAVTLWNGTAEEGVSLVIWNGVSEEAVYAIEL